MLFSVILICTFQHDCSEYFKMLPELRWIFHDLTITNMYLKACFGFLTTYIYVLLTVNIILLLPIWKVRLPICPCPWQGVGIGWPLRSLPTQTTLWFCDLLLKPGGKKGSLQQLKYSKDYSVTINLHQFLKFWQKHPPDAHGHRVWWHPPLPSDRMILFPRL